MAEEKKTDTASENVVQEAIRQAEQEAADRKAQGAEASGSSSSDADGKASQNNNSGEIPVQGADSAEDNNKTEDKSQQGGSNAADQNVSAGQDSQEEKKGFFGKRKDKEKDALKAQVADLTDKVKRQMAEFDNYRKRTEKEKEQMFSMGEKSVLEKMLPIVDNFERGFDTLGDDKKDDAFVQGMEKVYQQLVKQMKDLGVTPIDAAGKDFDPNFHNAVMQVDSDTLESGKVAQELQKGYMYHDTVLRHSMVSVVK